MSVFSEFEATKYDPNMRTSNLCIYEHDLPKQSCLTLMRLYLSSVVLANPNITYFLGLSSSKTPVIPHGMFLGWL